MAVLIGNKPNQVPTNGDLGTMAFRDQDQFYNTSQVDAFTVKLTGDQTIAGVKTFSSTIVGSINGNAATATNGVVTTGSYSNPTWLTSINGGTY